MSRLQTTISKQAWPLTAHWPSDSRLTLTLARDQSRDAGILERRSLWGAEAEYESISVLSLCPHSSLNIRWGNIPWKKSKFVFVSKEKRCFQNRLWAFVHIVHPSNTHSKHRHYMHFKLRCIKQQDDEKNSMNFSEVSCPDSLISPFIANEYVNR